MKTKRISKVIPFGFKESEDHGFLELIPSEIEALDEAQNYLKTCSYREVAEWVHRKTGRYISHVGLRKRIKDGTTTQAKAKTESESQKISTGDSRSV
mgnify:CR=1 FL=1|tara:strand:- start:99 stop:389 length:291 start_codon:yes stop_codon:yes gene_type:complete